MPDRGICETMVGTLLAFDFGEQRIGVAVGETLLGIAHPLETITTEVTTHRFTQISSLIKEWQPSLLLVGLPLHMDGQEHDITRLARRFARRLEGRFHLPLAMWDERLSSDAASLALNEAGVKGRQQKKVLDQVAAVQILQDFFDTPNRFERLIFP